MYQFLDQSDEMIDLLRLFDRNNFIVAGDDELRCIQHSKYIRGQAGGINYEELKRPLQFQPDPLGLSNWVLRFPLAIWSHDHAEKHVFHQDSITISVSNGPPADEKWRYFVTTREDGSRVYCTSLIYYELGTISNSKRLLRDLVTIEKENQQFYLPRCIIFMSPHPYFKLHVNLLKIHHELRKSFPNIYHPTSQRAVQDYLILRNQGKQAEWGRQEGNQGRPGVDLALEYYMGKVNEHKFGEVILFEKGSNKSILHLYRLRDDNPFQFSHFFNLPLPVETLRQVLICLLLQKQLIVASKSQNLNVMVIESLLQLIKPLRWEHMLVHNLPSHLVDAASQNFMPFVIGIHKRNLSLLSTSDKFLLVVDEGRLVCPEELPTLDFCLDHLEGQFNNPANHSHSNEKLILQHSIEFICKLMEPILKKTDAPSRYKSFYEDFSQTSVYLRFKELLEKGELKQFQRVASIFNPEDRGREIRRRLNEIQNLAQNPRFLDNQVAWMEFYLNKTEDKQERKAVTLKQIKQNLNLTPHSNHLIRKAEDLERERSYSSAQITARHQNRSGQKLKISMARPEKTHPLLAELLQHKLGLSKH